MCLRAFPWGGGGYFPAQDASQDVPLRATRVPQSALGGDRRRAPHRCLCARDLRMGPERDVPEHRPQAHSPCISRQLDFRRDGCVVAPMS